MTSASEIAKALHGKRNAGGWMVKCPAHNDKNPSLSVSDGGEGKTLFHCFAGCSQDAVIDGLRAKGLWAMNGSTNGAAYVAPTHPPIIVKKYDYRDEDGQLLSQVLRYCPKDFRPRVPVDGGWRQGSGCLDGVRHVPYRLPEIMNEDTVVFVEGEKDANALADLGIAATTKAGTAAGWPEGWGQYFQGKDVYVIPDNDAAGKKKAKTVVEALYGVASAVRYCNLTKDLPDKGDVSDWLEAEGVTSAKDVWDHLVRFAPATGPELIDDSNILKLRRADTLQAKLANDDIIEDLLIAGQMSVVYGPSNTGKSFVVTDLALHMALGMRWQSRAVERGAVIYVAAEGSYGITNRVVAFRKDRQISGPLPFFIHDRAINLFDDDEIVQRVIDTIRVTERTEGPVQLLVVDTLSRVMAGGDENTVKDMQQVVDACDQIRNETGVHVCLVHHTGKDASKGARGSSALRASTDTEIEIDRDDNDLITAKVTKQRDLEVAGEMACSLRVVELGQNPRGKMVTSCVVERREGGTRRKRPKTPRTANAKICWEALTNAMPNFSTRRKVNDQTVISCLKEEWYAQVRPVLTMDARHKRQAFDRAVNSLSANRFIGVHNEIVWIED